MPSLVSKVTDWTETAFSHQEDDGPEEEELEEEEEEAEEVVEGAIEEAFEEMKKELFVETNCGKIPKLDSIEEVFYNKINGMNRSYSGRTSTLTPRNSQMFDEEDMESRNFDVCHSGEMRFANSDHALFSQTSVAEVDNKLQEGGSGEWDPIRVAGAHSPDRMEHFSGMSEFPSDVQRFTDEASFGSCSMMGGSSKLSCNQSEACSDNNDNEDMCDTMFKLQVLAEAGFPLPFWGMGFGLPWWSIGMGQYGPPYPMHEPGVTVTKLKAGEGCPHTGDCEVECPMKKAGLCKDDAAGCICNKEFEGKAMVYVEKEEDDKCGGVIKKRVPPSRQPSSVVISAVSEAETNGTRSSMNVMMSKLKGCSKIGDPDNEDVTSQATTVKPDILAAVKAKKDKYEEEITNAMISKDALIRCCENGVFRGADFEKKLTNYSAALQAVATAKSSYRVELEKLGINIYGRLESLDDLINAAKPLPKIEPPPCGSKNVLTKLERDLGFLLETLPFNEFDKLRAFMSETSRKSVDDEGDMAEVGEDGDFKNANNKNSLCFPFCEVTCKKLKKGKKHEKSSQDEMVKLLTKSMFMETKKVTPSRKGHISGSKIKNRSRREVSEPVVITNRGQNAYFDQKQCLHTTMPKEDKNKRAQCFASTCDGRKDFRDIVGANEIKSLFPLLARIELGKNKKPVTPSELYKIVIECKIKSWDFNMKAATGLCDAWKSGRKIRVDEVLFAIKHPSIYLEMIAHGSLKENLPQHIRNWESKNPKAIKKSEPTSYKKPRKLYNLPKPSWGVQTQEKFQVGEDKSNIDAGNFEEEKSCSSLAKESISSAYKSPATFPRISSFMKNTEGFKAKSKLQPVLETVISPLQADSTPDLKDEQPIIKPQRISPADSLPVDQNSVHHLKFSESKITVIGNQPRPPAKRLAELTDESAIQALRRNRTRFGREAVGSSKVRESKITVVGNQPAPLKGKFSGVGRPNPPSKYEIEIPVKTICSYENSGGFMKSHFSKLLK